MRRAANRDAIEPLVLVALKAAGATWEQLDLTDGPDLAIGYAGRNFLAELKSSLKSMPTEGQARWHAEWCGQVAVCRSPQEVLRVIGAPFDEKVRAAIAEHTAKECRSILGPRGVKKLNRGRLASSVKSYATAEIIHPERGDKR